MLVDHWLDYSLDYIVLYSFLVFSSWLLLDPPMAVPMHVSLVAVPATVPWLSGTLSTGVGNAVFAMKTILVTFAVIGLFLVGSRSPRLDMTIVTMRKGRIPQIVTSLKIASTIGDLAPVKILLPVIVFVWTNTRVRPSLVTDIVTAA